MRSQQLFNAVYKKNIKCFEELTTFGADLRNKIEDLISLGDVKGAWLGISFQEISENLSLKLNLNDTKGVMVTQILKNSSNIH